ncbi:TonB-dependent receptor domain-containing protein [Stutzerimonas stutzeri]|uniref:B12 family TonB-dependent receptor n=1 Tax=Stutzerimonas stutzeri KOS6 TaxID=1218352 RepID=A0A061JPR6_STUST|nr:TonB-dependent receptor [Stutzerimonas stutzeri]EWC40623.1 B12 family TonB-dependent receptor [Stutzerimonas stutzeri KOS6]
MKLSRLALAVALLPGMQVFAVELTRDEALKLSDTVVSANREPQRRSQTPAATTVFNRDDIERLQVRSVAELLERVPGVSVARTGGAGSLTSLFMRGTASTQTLVLVDGQRIAAASSGTNSLEFLSPDQIERIEVVRGPRSALYGSDAIGGVVQIFTRQSSGQGLAPEGRFGVGSNGTFERSLDLSGGNGQTRFNLGAALDETQSIDATRDSFGANGDDDAYRNRSLSLNLAHRFNDSVEVGMSAIDQRGENEFDDLGGISKPTTDFQLSSTSGFVAAELNDAWNSRLEVGHSEDKRDTGNDTPQAPAYMFYRYSTYRDSASWVNTLQLAPAHQLLLGADWHEDQLHSSSAFAQDSRWNQAAFIQHRYTGNAFSTEIGLRHDKNEQYGSENTWNAALTVPLDTRNDVVVSYSEGFRAPTFNELYDSWYGNPDLAPEKSKSYELQWRNRYSESGSLELSLYRTDIEDAIVSDAFWIPQNVQTARINGLEATLQQDLFGWQASLAAGLIDPRDRDSGHTLARRAKRTLSLDLDRQLGAFSVGASWRAVSGRYDDADNEIEMGGYGLVGLRGSWRANQELKLDLKLDNLFDKDYAEATYSTANGRYGYNIEGRTALLAVTWTPSL